LLATATSAAQCIKGLAHVRMFLNQRLKFMQALFQVTSDLAQ
jgi:hypothetical protein